jgi:peroxiredoxin
MDFWAPSYGVCHLVSSELNRWQAKWQDQIMVLGISAGSPAFVARHVQKFDMPYPVLADPHERVVDTFHASVVPLLVVVDQHGVVRAISLGYSAFSLSRMEQLVAQLVANL